MFWTTTACKRIPKKLSPIAKSTNPKRCQPPFKKAPARLWAPTAKSRPESLAGHIATPRPRVERATGTAQPPHCCAHNRACFSTSPFVGPFRTRQTWLIMSAHAAEAGIKHSQFAACLWLIGAHGICVPIRINKAGIARLQIRLRGAVARSPQELAPSTGP